MSTSLVRSLESTVYKAIKESEEENLDVWIDTVFVNEAFYDALKASGETLPDTITCGTRVVEVEVSLGQDELFEYGWDGLE